MCAYNGNALVSLSIHLLLQEEVLLMAIPHICLVAAGAVAAGAVNLLGKSGKLHDGAVKVAAAGMRAADAVSAATQTIADEASDINAEAKRQARIDAAVKERLAAVEQEIRAEVSAEIDEAGAGADE
jgi:hypothetical protein